MSKRDALKLLAGLDNPDVLYLTPMEFIYKRGEIYTNLVLKRKLYNLEEDDSCT